MTPAASIRRILLINPNSSTATTVMMVAIAAEAAGDGFALSGATATRSPSVIVDPSALAASAAEVVEIAFAHDGKCDGMIVSAFGDPGLAEIRARIATPAVGIAESAMIEAASGKRSFGIATTTPDLAAEIDGKVVSLGLAANYVGIRVTDEDPAALMADPDRLLAALTNMVESCIRDGAEAVIIGGGPLGQVALRLQPMFDVPIIAPIQAAIRRLLTIIAPNQGP